MDERCWYNVIQLQCASTELQLAYIEAGMDWKRKKRFFENAHEMLEYCEATFDRILKVKDWGKGYIYSNLIQGIPKGIPGQPAYYDFIDTGIMDPKDPYRRVRTLARIRRVKGTIEDILKDKKVSKRSMKITKKFFNDLRMECIKQTPRTRSCIGMSALAA